MDTVQQLAVDMLNKIRIAEKNHNMRGTCNALFDRDGKGKDEVVVVCANCNTEQVITEKIGKIYDRTILGICSSCNYVLLYPRYASW